MEPIAAPEIKKGTYRHYKGALVEVIGVALHSETLEPFVNYRHITGEHGGEMHYWVRPYTMFLEEVEVNGEKMPRFTYEG
jgi:hypothetical protein